METYIIINGTPMTKKEYTAYRKAHTKVQPKKKVSKETKQITATQMAGNDITDLMKDLKVIDSLMAYDRNGYRQWGTIHTAVMNLKEIESPFIRFRMNARKMMATAGEIERLAKRNSRQIPSLLVKFGWEIEDTKTSLKTLIDGIKKSEVLYGLQSSECINGTGKRLGLRVLTNRSDKALTRMQTAAKEIEEMLREI